MNSPAIVRLSAVSKSFDSTTGAPTVLRDVNLSIAAGQKSSLVGRSGSGKSTLLSLIAGLLRPTSGSVDFDGTNISRLDDAARANLRALRIGIALQSDNLIPFLSASENVQLAMTFADRASRRDASLRAEALLDRFGVADRRRHRPRQLSGGEAQRVALAVAMANEPAVLLADEVVGQLDGETAERLIADVLATEYAVLFVTHDLTLADRAEHRYTITDGRVESR